jgi:NAD(P)H-hydrate epimerase
MKVVTREEMQSLDLKTQQKYLPEMDLMENAGSALARVLLEEYPEVKKVAIFSGKGNNAGDGLVAARYLLKKGIEIEVYLVGEETELKESARRNFELIKDKIKLTKITQPALPADFKVEADLIIDALFGIGLQGKIKGIWRRIVGFINGLKLPVVAVDIPSGLDATTGKPQGTCIEATLTVSFGLPKLGCVIPPGAEFCGKLRTVDIGIPREVIEEAKITSNLLTSEMLQPFLLPRLMDTHKGDYGKVLILAGSRGMTGAAYFASLGALRVGAGLVYLGIPASLNSIMEIKLSEAITIPLPETPDGKLHRDAFLTLKPFLEKVDVLVIGPGLGRSEEVKEVVTRLLSISPLPGVVDADGLNVSSLPFLTEVNSPVVLTPHPGEMARLLNKEVNEVKENRLTIAKEVASQTDGIVVLKGARTVISEPSGNIFINPTGNPGMATGGTGDILTGMIGGLIAQGLSLLHASLVGVYLHGLAGDLAKKRKGEYGMIPQDILDTLPEALLTLSQS